LVTMFHGSRGRSGLAAQMLSATWMRVAGFLFDILRPWTCRRLSTPILITLPT